MKKTIIGLFILCLSLPALASDSAKESAYDRVIRTRTLRCAYILLPPEFSKDINTGAFSGASYDITEEIGRRLQLKVEWTEEVNFQTAAPGLQNGRYDAVCFTLYRYSQAASVADFSMPLFYSGTGVFVRTDDKRFDASLDSLNSPDVTLATIDGEMSQFIATEDYPKAKTASMPQLTDLSQMLKNVETKKADAAFVNGLIAAGYLEANPGKLKDIAAKKPIRYFSHGFMLPKGQYDLRRMIDLTLEEMHDQGIIQKILNKYDPAGKSYLRLARPYEAPK